MADLSPQDILDFFNKLNPDLATQFFDKLAAGSETGRLALEKFTQKFSGVTDIAKEVSQTAAASFDSFKNIAKMDFSAVISSFGNVNQGLINMGGQAALVVATLRSGITPDAFNAMGDSVKGSNNSLNETVDVLSKAAGVIPIVGKELSEMVAKVAPFAKLSDSAKQFEAGLIQTTAASGELGDLLKNVGDDLSGLNLKAEKFTEMTYNIANASALSTKQVAEYAKELMAIPGAMDMTIASSEKGKDDIHLLDAAIKIAAGTGQNFNSVFQDMNEVYREFGTTGKSALEYVSRLSSASQGLKIPLDIVKNYTKSAADTFKFFGDNTQSAISIMERFGPALQASGLGPQAVADVVKNVTSAIGQMGIAQKAFLAQQTGGRGGLQGAYQIDLLLQQGKLDQVQQKVEDSLRKQFGGRIISLEEASKDSRAAGQYTKQIQFLTQGPTKIAGSEAEAERLLDVLGKGPGAKGGTIKSPEDAFKQALGTGDAIQERQDNKLLHIQNDMEKAVQLASITAYNLTRLVAGSEKTDLNAALRSARTGGSEIAAQTGKLVKGEGPLEGGSEVKEVVGDFFSHLPDQFHSAEKSAEAFKNHMLGLGENVKENVVGKAGGSGSNIQKTLQSRPISPVRRVSEDLAGEKIDDSQAAKSKATNQTKKETLEINVHAVCAKCNKTMAEQSAYKIGQELIQANENNKNISIHTGANHGIGT